MQNLIPRVFSIFGILVKLLQFFMIAISKTFGIFDVSVDVLNI